MVGGERSIKKDGERERAREQNAGNYAGQEETVRTEHGTIDWFQIGKGVGQGCI